MNKDEKRWQAALREMGCSVCYFFHDAPETECSVHHLVSGHKKLGELYTIGLCPRHHQYGTKDMPSIHSWMGKHGGKKAFKDRYCSEDELLERCREHLNWVSSEEQS